MISKKNVGIGHVILGDVEEECGNKVSCTLWCQRRMWKQGMLHLIISKRVLLNRLIKLLTTGRLWDSLGWGQNQTTTSCCCCCCVHEMQRQGLWLCLGASRSTREKGHWNPVKGTWPPYMQHLHVYTMPSAFGMDHCQSNETITRK